MNQSGGKRASPGAPQLVSLDGGLLKITDKEFAEISALIYETFGICLTDKKRGLVRGRLDSLLKSKGFSSFSEYIHAVRSDPTGSSLSSLIDRISTNHSFFFRESAHFDFLAQEVLPELCGPRGCTPAALRFWSAGCAAGEEPYTLAMLLHDRFGDAVGISGPVILGTDVSMRALERAASGVYPEQRVAAVPARYRRYFRKTAAESYEVVEEIKRLVLFKRLNLMRGSFPFKGSFHVVFCRNVMIYFDQAKRRELVSRIRGCLNPGGYLFIGHSETLGREASGFRYVLPTVYRK